MNERVVKNWWIICKPSRCEILDWKKTWNIRRKGFSDLLEIARYPEGIRVLPEDYKWHSDAKTKANWILPTSICTIVYFLRIVHVELNFAEQILQRVGIQGNAVSPGWKISRRTYIQVEAPWKTPCYRIKCICNCYLLVDDSEPATSAATFFHPRVFRRGYVPIRYALSVRV